MSDSKPSTPRRDPDRVRVIKNELFDPDVAEANVAYEYLAGQTYKFNPDDLTLKFDNDGQTTVFKLQMVERAPSRREKAKDEKAQ